MKGAPHASEIVLVAVTDERDAALTADAGNGLRLWPALDGSRTPLPIAFASEPVQLAITHAGRDLVAIILDRGGALTLLRLGLDGSARGRTQLRAADAAFVEVITSGDHIFARTDAHTVAWYSADGTQRGGLAPEPGHLVTDLTARNGRIAVVTTAADGAHLRPFTVTGDQLRWQPVVKLPLVPRADLLALAPTRDRIAFVDVHNRGLHVLDLAGMPKLVAGTRMYVNESTTAIGFVDDDTIAVATHNIAWWQATNAPTKPPPPYLGAGQSGADAAAVDDDDSRGGSAFATPPPARDDALRGDMVGELTSMPLNLSGTVPRPAFVTDRLVTTMAGSLVIATRAHVQYLGWRTTSFGASEAPGGGVVITQRSSRFTWLDDDLQQTHTLDIQDKAPATSSWSYGAPVGTHHLIMQTHRETTAAFTLINAAKPDERFEILPFSRSVETYYINEGMLAIKVGRTLRRFKLDFATTTATEMLPALRVRDYSLSNVRLFDPEFAGGLVAVTVAWPSEWANHQTLTYYWLRNGKLEKQQHKKFEGHIVKAMSDGRLFIFSRQLETDEPRLQIVKDGELLREITHEHLAPSIAISHGGTRIALRDESHVIMIDETGAELWRTPMWGATSVMATPTGRRIIVTAHGGLAAFDATSGAMVNRECGFDFGLTSQAPDFGPHGFASVCEDPIVQ